MCPAGSGHGEHLALVVFAFELRLAFDFEVLFRCEECLGLCGHWGLSRLTYHGWKDAERQGRVVGRGGGGRWRGGRRGSAWRASMPSLTRDTSCWRYFHFSCCLGSSCRDSSSRSAYGTRCGGHPPSSFPCRFCFTASSGWEFSTSPSVCGLCCPA